MHAIDIVISIHAPLRGRLMHAFQDICGLGFQSTPPCGGDPDDVLPLPGGSYFNPRPLAGATGTGGQNHPQFLISIHAPLRGRPVQEIVYTLRFDFNPRPLAGATPYPKEHYTNHTISIHAPLRGRRAQG